MKRMKMAMVPLGLMLTMLVPSPISSQQPVQRTIRVGGIGEVLAMPDEARVTFAVETAATTARAAAQRNAETMERVIQALTRAGIPRADIQTLNFSIHPQYEEQRPPRPGMEQEGPRIRGYRAMNQVVLRTRDLEQVGGYIDLALEAGANRMDGVGFMLRDAEQAQAEALSRAVAQARSAAETMARALGVTLGEVIDASTSMDLVYPRPMQARGGMREDLQMAAPVQIQPGEQTVRAQASLVFSIGR